MEIYFANKLFTLEGVYDGVEDLPGLALSVHLHSWEFPHADQPGEARLRVEIREGDSQPTTPLVATGFVRSTPVGVLEWQGYAPLAQALLDGLMSHPPVRDFFARASREALKLPSEEPDPEENVRIPLKALKKKLKR